MKKLVALLVVSSLLIFSFAWTAPAATIKLRANPRVMQTGLGGLTEIPLVITVTASGGVWLEVSLGGNEYQSSSVNLVPEHTVQHTFLRLPAGVYDAEAIITSEDGKVLAKDSQTVEVR